MAKRFNFILIGVFAFNLFAALPPEYEALKAEAERVYWERPHLYAKVNELYGQFALANLPPAERRWVRFRLADTQWRKDESIGQKAYAARVMGARDQLQDLISDIKRVEDRDEVWAEAHASLGDISTEAGTDSPGKLYVPWEEGVSHYKEAFAWLAVEHDAAPPPNRFLAILARITLWPSTKINLLPFEMLEKGIRLSPDNEQKAQLHYLTASKLLSIYGVYRSTAPRSVDDPVAVRARIVGEFEAALSPGRTNRWWYSEALHQYAVWNDPRIPSKGKNGSKWEPAPDPINKPDHAKALQLYRRIVNEFQEDKNRTDSAYQQSVHHRDQAQARIKKLTEGKADDPD